MLTRNFLNPYLNAAYNHLPISLIYAHSIPNIRALFIRRALIARLSGSPLRAWISLALEFSKQWLRCRLLL